MKERNYGLDLYKVIGMLCIVAFHFTDHGAIFLSYTQPITFNWIVMGMTRVDGGFLNSVFMIITGYYLVNSEFKAKTVIRLYLQVWFFSVFTGLLACALGIETFGRRYLLRQMMPLSTCQYWFFSAYIILYMIFPFLNLAISHMNEIQHRFLVIVGVAVISLPYTIHNGAWFIGTSHVPLFIIMYLSGAYFRKYPVKLSRVQISILLAIALVITFSSLFVMRYVCARTGGEDNVLYFGWGEERLMPVLTSFLVFLWFKDLRVKHFRGIITTLSTSVFGVYLLHISKIHPFIFMNLFNDSKTYETPWFLPQMLLAVVSIFAAGIIIDKLRLFLLEKPLMNIFDKQIKMLDDKMQKFYPRRS